MWGCALSSGLALSAARSIIRASPAVVNGDPRSLTKTMGDVGLSRWSRRKARSLSPWMGWVLPASLQPLIDLGLALEALDVAKLGAGIVGLDLPLVLGDALVFEFDWGLLMRPLWPLSASATSPASHAPRPTSNRSRYDRAPPRERFRFWSLAANMMPPRDPNDDDEDEDRNVNGDEFEDEEPSVIREPDE